MRTDESLTFFTKVTLKLAESRTESAESTELNDIDICVCDVVKININYQENMFCFTEIYSWKFSTETCHFVHNSPVSAIVFESELFLLI